MQIINISDDGTVMMQFTAAEIWDILADLGNTWCGDLRPGTQALYDHLAMTHGEPEPA